MGLCALKFLFEDDDLRPELCFFLCLLPLDLPDSILYLLLVHLVILHGLEHLLLFLLKFFDCGSLPINSLLFFCITVE